MPVPSSIEEVISGVGYNGLLKITLVHLAHATIIELIPLIVERILGVGSIMTEAHISIMVGNSVAVIDH